MSKIVDKAITADDFNPSAIASFWSKTRVRTSGCIEFTGWKGPGGYGRVEMKGSRARAKKRVLAHRAAYAMMWGFCPADKKVLHSCDNPKCVSPGHLFLGTQADNVADMIAKGRANFRHNGRGKQNAA